MKVCVVQTPPFVFKNCSVYELRKMNLLSVESSISIVLNLVVAYIKPSGLAINDYRIKLQHNLPSKPASHALNQALVRTITHLQSPRFSVDLPD
jgi:hypothetical protein